MAEKYANIIRMIKQAREQDNKKQLKYWTSRLNTWQLAYGAYAPIK